MRTTGPAPTLRRKLTQPAVLVAFGAVVVGAIAVGIMSTYQTNESWPPTLREMVIHTVVVVTMDDGPGRDDTFPSSRLWDGTVGDVLWDRGDFLLASGQPANVGLPAAGDTMTVSIPPHYEIETGGTYVFAMSRAFWSDPAEQQRWPWQYQVGLDSASGYLPIEGTAPGLAAEIDLVTLQGETQAVTIVAVSKEIAALLDAQIAGTEKPDTPRLIAIGRIRR